MNKTVLSSFTILCLLSTVLLIGGKISVEASPETIYVPDDHEKIQWAIGNASTGDTIYVRQGTYYEHVVVNKSISLIGENIESTIINGTNTGTAVTITANNVTLSGFTIANNKGVLFSQNYGIFVSQSNNTRISNNTITDCWVGIQIENGFESTMIWNNVTLNDSHGIRIDYLSVANITENSILLNSGPGIWVANCENITITKNRIAGNDRGVRSSLSKDCIISENEILNNSIAGIELYAVHYRYQPTMITSNNITDNRDYGGIWLKSSEWNNITNNFVANNSNGVGLNNAEENCIYHNNFVENQLQVMWAQGRINANRFDNGYPSGGNYWNDYDGTDTNQDGIGDTSYLIGGSHQDNYPLMGMFHSFNTTLGKHVNVVSNSTIEDFDYFESNRTIKMYVSNMTSDQTSGFCRVTIPHTLMNVTNIEVIIDNDTTPLLYHNYTLYDNDTHRWIYFAYPHSIHEIEIIPEFPSLLILPLSMMATLLAVIVYRRKHAKRT